MTRTQATMNANRAVQAIRMAALNARTEIAAVGFAAMPIDTARAVIEASRGSLTWSEAGDTWARVVAAPVPGTEYPAL